RNNGHLMTVQTQAERARGAAVAARQFAQLPQIVGSHWFQYYDHPPGGRGDGEDYNFGLVDVDDRPYEALVAAFSRANPSLTAIHHEARPVYPAVPAGRLEIPAADIDLHDHSLRDWPKEQALIRGLVAPSPEIVFGDVYVAWNSAGLYLATISMDYYDAELLAYGDTFPLEEAFHLAWGVDAGAGPQRFTLYVIPPKVFPKDGTPAMRLQLCQTTLAACTPVPAVVATYLGGDVPRIVAEVFLPGSALGVPGPPPQRQLRLELATTGWYRARWMSWSGLPPEEALRDPAHWRVVRLGEGLLPAPTPSRPGVRPKSGHTDDPISTPTPSRQRVPAR